MRGRNSSPLQAHQQTPRALPPLFPVCPTLHRLPSWRASPAILTQPEFGGLMPLTIVLSVGPDASLLETRNIVLHSAGYLVESASSVNEAAHRFLAGDFDLVILCHSVPTRERERLTCLIRASGSRTPIISISGNLRQCDAFATATIEDGPNFLIGVRAVLNKAAGAWSVLPRLPSKTDVVASSQDLVQQRVNLEMRYGQR
jgi:CheY-like chemotaxis protein